MAKQKLSFALILCCVPPCLSFSSPSPSRIISGASFQEIKRQESSDKLNSAIFGRKSSDYGNGNVESVVAANRWDWDRRSFAGAAVLLSPWLLCRPGIAGALLPPTRDVDVGEGFDLFADRPLREKDVAYPPSMEGSWVCDRTVTQIEGDQFQAKEAWRALGGSDESSFFKVDKVESFRTRYTKSPLLQPPPQSSSPAAETGYVVNDRGFELASRRGSVAAAASPGAGNANLVTWKPEEPDVLGYDAGNGRKVEIRVKKRSVEPPTDAGFGFDELLYVRDGYTVRAVRVKRRYRRAYDETGNRLVEGLEIVKTYRVLDGIAGTEFPTSTVKSRILLRRTPTPS